jgi:ketosteroid isomerase-like protein
MPMMEWRLRALAIGALATGLATGCPSTTAVEVEAPAATDTSVAANGARDLMKEIYSSVRRGAPGGLLALVEPTVLVIGPGPSDFYVERSAALVALGVAVKDGEKHKLTSTDLRVVASPAGHAAWASDLIQVDGKPYLLGVIMVEADELWTVAAIQIGAPVNKKQLAALIAKGPIPEPGAVPQPGGGSDKVLAALWKDAATSPAALADQVAKRPNAVARELGGKAVVGHKAIRKAWKRAHKQRSTAPTADPVHASVSPDGTLGWVFGTVLVTDGKGPPVPTRSLHVYDKTDDGWELVLVSPSLAQAR